MEQNPFINVRMKYPVFGGKKNQSYRQFISKYQKWIEFENLRPEHQIMALGICLEYDALDAFDCIRRQNPNATIEEIKELLKLRYDEEADTIGIRHKIGKRRLKKGESIQDYYREMRLWADKIDLDDETLKYELINGLPQYMIEHIVSRGTDTSIDVIKQAKRLEQARRFSRSNENYVNSEIIKESRIATAAITAAAYKQGHSGGEIEEVRGDVDALVRDLIKEKTAEEVGYTHQYTVDGIIPVTFRTISFL